MSGESPLVGTIAGKLHLLDLAGIKDRVGARWEKSAVLVERFLEAAIRRNLGPGDTFIRHGEMSYVLLLRGLSSEEAQIKCHTICEQLSGRLFGEEVPDASLRALIAPWTGPTLHGEGAAEAIDAFLESEGKESILRVNSPSNENMLTPEKVDAAVEKQKRRSEEEDIYHLPLKFHYRPIWDTAVNVVISYLCQNIGSTEALSDSAAGMGGVEGLQASIDQNILQECATSVLSVHRRGFRLIFGVSVALDTISYSRLWRQYSRELQKIPPNISRDFIFFVNKIDNGVPNIRLAQELPKLSKSARGIFCILSDRGYVGARFSRTGAHAIGIELTPGLSESTSMARIVELAQQAATARLAAFVLGIPSKSLMLHAMSHGIRYLEGPVIRSSVPEPRYAFAQSLEDIYASA